MKPFTKGLVTALLAGLLAGAVFVGTAGAAGGSGAVATGSAGCTAVTNIEAILDDSGSMSITDPNKLRVQAMDLLIKTLPSTTTLGGVEFGSGFEAIPGIVEGHPAAFTLFPPEPIGPNAAGMEAAMKANINADDGATDYNGAFAKADADNPTAQARIFLTDGGHDEGTYNEAHLAHNVPTYVIGFGSGLGLTEDKARLKKIAADTGGKVYELEDDSELQAVVNSIGAELTCQTPPRKFTDELTQGQSKIHSITVGAKTHSLQVTLTWANPGDIFKLTGLRIKSHGKIVAVSRPKPASKINVSVKAKSSTFTVLNVSHLRPGTLFFSVKGAKVSGGAVKVTTQVGGG
ncbi:MAG TPA: vWA domain-containing protein [Solirubrobacterales bacterium]|nr:vWA domain-containing protein [Solirubrobacterales bacterium]